MVSSLYAASRSFPQLLRGTMAVNEKGHLHIAQLDVCALAQLSAFPIYVLDEDLVRQKMRSYRQSLQAFYPKESLVYYASKAMMNLAICRIAEEEGLGLDVSSGGELHTAIRAHFPMDKVIFHGNNKSEEELRMAVAHRVGRIALDSLYEAELLGRLCSELQTSVEVLVRMTPGVAASTHSYIATGSAESKFGIALNDAEEAIAAIRKIPGLRFKGIHCHIGSQILDLTAFEKAVGILADFCSGTAIEELNFGGGLGAQYTLDDEPIPIEAYTEFLAMKIREAFAQKGIALPRLMLEPGRSIVAEAGTTLYRVGSIKKMPHGFLYAAVNGGMSDNIRPPLYGAKYHAMLANRALEPLSCKVKVVGKCCESGDILIQEIFLPEPMPGDVLAVFSTGAYNYATASNYNRLPIPGILLVKDGHSDWIVLPQDYDDLLRNDRIPTKR